MAQITKETEVVVIGAGPAGYVCAIRLAQLGKKVTVIERERVGGVCLNVGCIPSKALITAGLLYEKMTEASAMGIECRGVRVDFQKLQAWKASIVQKLTQGVESLLKANGCELVRGEARFKDAHTLEIQNAKETTLLRFKQGVIATGSRPASLLGVRVDHKQILDSSSALSLKRVPKTLLCVGGGYIGLELGTFFAKMGSQVTVVEATGSLLSGVDPELTKVVKGRLEKRGVEIGLETKVIECKTHSKGVLVTLGEMHGYGGNGSKSKHAIYKNKPRSFDAVLVTVGRVPNSETLSLEKAGLKVDAKGFLVVNGERRTAVPHLFAIGDIAGGPLLAHKGSKEGLVAAEVIAGRKTVYDVVAMPAVIFTDPEIATVGFTDQEARAKGFDVRVGVFPFVANGRALSMRESDGFVKVVGDAKTGRLLGVHVVGPEASNLIAEAALALEMGASVEDIALTVHAHPTLPEALMEAAEATLGQAIHIFKPRREARAPQVNA